MGIEEAAEPDSLLLDVTGIGTLCGGESALALKIIADFRTRRLIVRVAIADTPGAAWAMTHFAPLECAGRDCSDVTDRTMEAREASILAALAEPLLISPAETAAALAPLPPAALRLAEETCLLLGELGIHRIEQLAALRRETLLARFGPLVLLKLDQTLGTAAEAIVARAVPPEWAFDWLLDYPTGRREMIEWVVEQLVARVCVTLARERRGVLRLGCRFVPERGAAEEFIVGLFRPSASERHIGELVRLKLEAVRIREPLTAVRFEVLALGMLEFQQRDFLTGDETSRDDSQALATLVDRLSNRLGAQSVARPWLLARAAAGVRLPVSAGGKFAAETCPARRACSWQAEVGETGRSHARVAHAAAGRSSPVTRAGTHGARRGVGRARWSAVDISAAWQRAPDRATWGSERIETGWWRSRCVRRDYYQVETREGLRYWLFRELNTGQWFLHGEFM